MYHNPGCVLDGDKPAYQSLMKEDASARFNSESNLGMYQSLDQDRLMYQPLQKNNTHKVLNIFPLKLIFFNTIIRRFVALPPSLHFFLSSFLPSFLLSFLPSIL